jgi:luciferase family oxidoreductase group 1
MSYFAPAQPGQKVKAIPGAGLDIPIWILGSSTYSAHLAAAIGRPYAFASHFAPGDLMESLAIYRREFRRSPALAEPYVMVGVPAMAAETDERAEFLATSMYLRSLGIVRGDRAALQPPVESMDGLWSPAEQLALAERMALMVVGGPDRVKAGLQEIIDLTQADELVMVSDAYAASDRRRSFDLIAEAAGLPRTID